MADKILRPITDVEIVEQMTENDTVLIEQNGAIKRTKGVVGGEKYIINAVWDEESGSYSFEWNSTPLSYEQLSDMVKKCTPPDIYCVEIYEGDIVRVECPGMLHFEREFGDDGNPVVPIKWAGIMISFWNNSVMVKPDDTLIAPY